MARALPRRAPRKREPARSSLVIRNIVVGGHRTSFRLEPVMWEALLEIARQRQTNVNQLVTEIDRRRVSSSLTAAIRVYIVDFYRAAAIRLDHAAADFQSALARKSRKASAHASRINKASPIRRGRINVIRPSRTFLSLPICATSRSAALPDRPIAARLVGSPAASR